MASAAISLVRAIRFSFPVRFSSCYPSTPLSTLLPASCKYERLSTIMKTTQNLQPKFHHCAFTFQYAVNIARKHFQSLNFPSCKLNMGSTLGSAVLGSISILPCVARAMGNDAVMNGPGEEAFEKSRMEEDPQNFWTFARKLWLPFFFFLTVLTNLDYPVSLITIKVVLFLLSTKPSPLSVYAFVDQTCLESMQRTPHLYKSKSLYASKVEVMDFKLLCLAKVEVGDQKFTLVGVLGSWWVYHHCHR